ncbi:MAG: phospholipase A [Muribaculaceae bacterium]
MLRKIILIQILLFSALSVFSQIVADVNNKYDVDSVRDAFDNGPYFTLYKDNYFLAGTTLGHTPSRKNSDVKFQISISQRLTKSTLPFNTYLFLMYNQKCFWNVFEESMPMRDLNFNPGIGLTRLIIVRNRLVGKSTLIIEHESNGKAGKESRSWNRITFGANIFIDPHFMIHGKVWIPIIDGQNNRDILEYCGIYQTGISLMSSNKRLGFSVILTKRQGWNFNFNTIIEFNYRIFKKDNQYLFLQYYNGYGESLIDYNKFQSRIRAGLVIKPTFFSDY